MKKYLFIFLILLVGLFIPFVNAEELPTEGVTYFLTYPNGDTDVVETYSVAMDVKERLLYEGYTNGNGQLVLSGWNDKGVIRIVQEVPNGYTTNLRETTVDLSKTNNFGFVDYRGLSNPTTSRSLLFLISVIVVLISTAIIVKYNKKALLVLPLFLILFGIYTVHAWQKAFVITVVDGKGQALENVHVLVYGKPTIEAHLAVKFDANGGNFFDGSTTMWYIIPRDGCTLTELMNSLSEEEQNKLNGNVLGAYKDGFSWASPTVPDELHNGSVIKMNWTQSDDGLFRIVGNGGTYDFLGDALPEVTVYENQNLEDYINNFTNDNNYFIGTDNNPSCSSYKKDGTGGEEILKKDTNIRETIYLCWNSKPDGIYVNGSLFRGNAKTCYSESYFYVNDNNYNFYNNEYMFTILDDNNASFGLYSNGGSRSSANINSIEIVKGGETIVYITSTDLVFNNNMYKLTNNSKNEVIYDILDDLFDNGCLTVLAA